jgi:hypothetical protein
MMHDSYPAGGFRGNNIDSACGRPLKSFVRGSKSGRVPAPAGARCGRPCWLLAERPMHGYQIIREIEERSGGSWKPSAGSVYPTLQLLADEGFRHRRRIQRTQDLLAD